MPHRRIILLGSTGFTGRRVLAGLVTRGITPLLLGRDASRIATLRTVHGIDFPIAEVDVADEAALSDIIAADDVVVSTVGPFQKLGRPVARVTALRGGRYLDSTGEPPFIRWIFDELDGTARTTGAALIPAFGYDYVPGNLAGAIAISRARGAARHVEVGYFLLPGHGDLNAQGSLTSSLALTTGATHASLLGVVAEPSFAFRGGALRPGLADEPSAARLRSFMFREVTRAAVTVGGSEHLGLPQNFPDIESVDVCLGWFGGWSRALHVTSTVLAPVLQTPTTRRALSILAGRLPGSTYTPSGPGTTLVLARTRDHRGKITSQVALAGTEPYRLTGELLADGAVRAATENIGTGALGPVAAFGIEQLQAMATRAGLTEVDDTLVPASPLH